MKPAPFAYHGPRTLDAALALLDEHGADEARVLAGGQSLMPAMAFRLARPGHLVDINGIDSLRGATVAGGEVTIRALTRHAAFHDAVAPGPLGALLTAVAHNIAHYPIRLRGTFCGSLAHADPASEWCLAAVTLGATLELTGKAGQRHMPAHEFLQGLMMTAIAPGEIVTAVRLPLLPEASATGFYEFSRRPGDFAVAMALAVLELRHGTITNARLGVGAVEGKPRRLPDVEAFLTGKAATHALFAEAGARAAEAVEPMTDPVNPAEFRRKITATVVTRALEKTLP